MSLINKLNSVAVYKTIGELEEGKAYKILALSLKSTEYGEAIQAILEGENEEKCRTFLPKRYRECFSEKEIQQYDGSLSMIYEGKQKKLYQIKFI